MLTFIMSLICIFVFSCIAKLRHIYSNGLYIQDDRFHYSLENLEGYSQRDGFCTGKLVTRSSRRLTIELALKRWMVTEMVTVLHRPDSGLLRFTIYLRYSFFIFKTVSWGYAYTIPICAANNLMGIIEI